MAASLSDGALPPGFEIESQPIPDGWEVEVKKQKPAEARAYKPSWRDTIASLFLSGAPSDQRTRAVEIALGSRGLGKQGVGGVVDFIPGANIPFAVDESRRDAGEGDWTGATINAMAAIPGAKPGAAGLKAAMAAAADRAAATSEARALPKQVDSTLRAKNVSQETAESLPLAREGDELVPRPAGNPNNRELLKAAMSRRAAEKEPGQSHELVPYKPPPQGPEPGAAGQRALPSRGGWETLWNPGAGTHRYRPEGAGTAAPGVKNPHTGAYDVEAPRVESQLVPEDVSIPLQGGPEGFKVFERAVNHRLSIDEMTDATKEKLLSVARADGTRTAPSYETKPFTLTKGEASVKPGNNGTAVVTAEQAPRFIRRDAGGGALTMHESGASTPGSVWMVNAKTGEVRNSLEIPGEHLLNKDGSATRVAEGWHPLYDTSAKGRRKELSSDELAAYRKLWGNPSGSLWDDAWMPKEMPPLMGAAVRQHEVGRTWGDILADLATRMKESGVPEIEIIRQMPEVSAQVARNLMSVHQAANGYNWKPAPETGTPPKIHTVGGRVADTPVKIEYTLRGDGPHIGRVLAPSSGTPVDPRTIEPDTGLGDWDKIQARLWEMVDDVRGKGQPSVPYEATKDKAGTRPISLQPEQIEQLKKSLTRALEEMTGKPRQLNLKRAEEILLNELPPMKPETDPWKAKVNQGRGNFAR
jgi:hypothetical protein